MKKILISTVLSFMSCSTFAYSIAEYKANTEKVGETKNYMEMYVIGFGSGLQWATGFNRYREAPEIFCPPKNLAVTGDVILSVVNTGLKKTTYAETDPLELFIVKEMGRVFPCK
jgi:CRISPR/Cas system CSM-associated protein Csm5 (group 7 of RAMP superfamily)